MKNIFMTLISAVIAVMVPCCAYAAETTTDEKGNTFLYVGLAGIALLILAMVYYNRRKKKDE